MVIENTDSKPQSEYYIPFKAEDIGKVGGLEVRDKKDPEKPAYLSETVEYDPYRYEKYFFRSIAYTVFSHDDLALPNSTVSPFLHHWPHQSSRPSQYPTKSYPL